MPSFDIVSEINMQEVDNAINQARKEVSNRYDFKGSQSEILWDQKIELTLLGEDEYKINAMKDILQTKLHRRGVDIKALKFSPIEPAGGKKQRLKITLQQGIEKEIAKNIVKSIKDSKLKVQSQMVEDKVRVTSKSIDDLQAVMQKIRQEGYPIPLQFNNMRS